MPDFTIQLWGDTSVGKTMLLSAAFGDPSERSTEFPQFTFSDKGTRLKKYRDYLIEMKRGRMPPPTGSEHGSNDLIIELAATDQRSIAVRDIKGGSWRDFTDEQRRTLAKETDAILFLVAWDVSTLERRLNVVQDLLPHLEAHVANGYVGLVFTQCDRASIQLYDFTWQEVTENEQFRHDEVIRRLQRYGRPNSAGRDFFTTHFGVRGERIWFTSAWGYADQEEQYSASALTDFGDCLPCNIHPVHVRQPFAAMFSALLRKP
jgi:GTPase SAR1 family protein